MTTLEDPILGTPKESGWPYYDLQMMTSHLLREYFDTSKYQQSITLALLHDERVGQFLDELSKTGTPDQNIMRRARKNASELSAWAKKMKADDFHPLYINSFIGMWSSFEAGLENIMATFLERDTKTANQIVELFKPKPVYPKLPPWSRETSMLVVRKLERRAMNQVDNAAGDVFSRYKSMFGWLGVNFVLDTDSATVLAEANTVRNVLLHRYGKIEAGDVARFPSLAEWEGKVMPMNQETITRYFRAINAFLISLLGGIKAKWPPTG